MRKPGGFSLISLRRSSWKRSRDSADPRCSGSPSRYEVSRVPANVRNRALQTGTREPVPSATSASLSTSRLSPSTESQTLPLSVPDIRCSTQFSI